MSKLCRQFRLPAAVQLIRVDPGGSIAPDFQKAATKRHQRIAEFEIGGVLIIPAVEGKFHQTFPKSTLITRGIPYEYRDFDVRCHTWICRLGCSPSWQTRPLHGRFR